MDDDALYREIMAKVLRRHGYEVRMAASGEQALAFAASVDVALVDMMMPGMDGLETIAELLWRNSALRIIACSGLAEALFRRQLDRLGVARFLAKPFGFEHFLEEIEAHSERAVS